MATKRLIVLSDGTWQTLENSIPTNILRLGLGILREDENGVQQVIMYDAGVGTDNGEIDKILGGAFGLGIDKNIQQLYTFLAMNYDDGDEIYLFGFSRGAYTIRSLAGMISHSGLVRREHVQNVKEAYDLYREVHDREAEKAVDFRQSFGETVPIKLLTCFDTVGALGIPGEGLLDFFRQKPYAFHNTTLGSNILNAIHCVSLDENRKSFQPTLMNTHPDNGETQVTQKFFWGGHGGVGGGDANEKECSDITLCFVLQEMERRGLKLAFDKSKIPAIPSVTKPQNPIKRNILMSVIGVLTGSYVRKVPDLHSIHDTAAERYRKVVEWRPASLLPFGKEIEGEGTKSEGDREKSVSEQKE